MADSREQESEAGENAQEPDLFAETLTAAGIITPGFLYSRASGSGYQVTLIVKGL
jgi:hypothetical protein